MALTLLPAVDVADGQAVGLVRGDAGTAAAFGEPLAAALDWQNQGATWLHLVDLDAAFGRGDNAALLADVITRVDAAVELSGGIDDPDSLATALATGATRVNLSAAALVDLDWCVAVVAEHGERVAVCLDVRGRTLAPRGHAGEGGDLYAAVARLDEAGCARYVLTDVVKDGAMSGPNLALYEEFCSRTSTPVIASGGVSRAEDLRALTALESVGLEGVIVGKALYAGAFTVTEALK
ncbi:MAG: bifunctional 1-(5-phosphoribosyl)-5-((5-phosphoribosylamino)methylideneamino)imidazole-4-carboxamide isomerase/phosphoribosylanthranilate isomerase PriA, partial [Longispora sp.]|nr:bifunctional 1-(5-phosphoribosyl)-5-((5-phosphoribosylamino)methylideneamino)imidazole-4-carboxamide isomerase/phosphoribosylanthranilate isomerase PriA [Longispora sp. (in: high G+C Gram-positive bacteria)]